MYDFKSQRVKKGLLEQLFVLYYQAYRDIPDVKDDWYDDLEENKYREVLNIQSQIEAINNEIAYLQVNMLPFLTSDSG